MAVKEMTSRQIKADETKRKIYEKAMRLFRRKGYDTVKIIDICKAADVSVGTFYYYYKSKEDIVEDGLARHNEALSRIMDAYTPTDPLSNIRYFIYNQMRVVRDFNRDDLAIIYGYRLFLAASGRYSSEHCLSIMTVNEFLVKQVKDAIEKGIFKEGLKVDDVVDTIRRQSRGCSYDWCLHGYTYDLVETRMHDLELLLKGWMK